MNPPQPTQLNALRTITLSLIVVLPALLLTQSCSTAPEEIEFDNAWIRPLIPSKTTTSGYVTIQNNGSDPLILVEANSETIDYIEFHSSTLEDGKHRMQLLDYLEIKPGETLVMTPGENHLMLFGVQNESLEKHQIEFSTQDGNTYSHEFVVMAKP